MGSRAIKGRYNVKKKNGKILALSILAIIVAIGVATVFSANQLVNTWLEDLPDYTNTDEFSTSSTSVVYASDGTTVLAEFQLENRTPVEINQISQYVLEGTVATEDERFYSHQGVDLYGTARAMVNTITGTSLEGGSTITQQLVRNTILSEEMTDISIKRKVREMYLAQKVEEMYTKDEILLMYLNTINYGSGAYGIEAAAQKYFSVSASELTLAQAAALVGIPQSPTYNNPIDHLDACKARRDLVLTRMVANGYITDEEAAAAKAEELVLNVSETSETGILAYPYFTSYVRNQLLNQDGKYAFSTADLFAGGLKIITTLDVDDQAAAEDAAATKEAEAGSDFEVAMVAIDPDNGYIKAMVGGKDYENDQINMATGEGSSGRQCGSAFKTFTLCAAIEAGIDPSTMIDAGYSITLDGAETVYNYGKHNYGTRSIESAFAVSSNTAFTRLIMSVGVDKVKDMAKRLGITSSLQSVAGLTLGISSVTPLEMSSAYATIANGGTYYAPECIIKITDRNGNVIVDNSNPTGERVISEEVAAATVDVMESVVNYGTGTEAKLSNGQVAAGKTGTTETEQDSWFCGITPQMSVAIWLGERAANYSEAKSVYSTATSVFSDFMNQILKGQKTEDFPEADEPDYDEDYFDAKYHIGSSGSWTYSDMDDKGSTDTYWWESSSSSSSSTSDDDVDDSTPSTSGGGLDTATTSSVPLTGDTTGTISGG